MAKLKSAFAAFPGHSPDIRASIEEVAASNFSGLAIKPWPALDIVGLKLDSLIRQQILEVDALIADITFPNFNVYYEVGYALGAGKPIIPIVNSSFESHFGNVALTGIFDVMGYLEYQNSSNLAERLNLHELADFTSPYIKKRNYEKPLYMIQPLVKPEFISYTVSSVENSFLEYRKYDQDENPRMYAAVTIGDVSSSAGVIIPLVSKDYNQALVHNLKAAFVAGLCHGMSMEPLIIQYDNLPAPLDYRENVKTARSRREIDADVSEYCQRTLVNNQRAGRYVIKKTRSILEEIDLGASAAENEADLASYFVETAQFKRVERANAAVVIGRKGAGKTAVLNSLFSNVFRDKRKIVIELAPSSHNLSELRERLTQVMSAGVFDHTMVAFWQYIIYTEILLKLREVRLPFAKNSLALQDEIRSLEDRFNLGADMVAGDFTSRLDIAITSVLAGISALSAGSDPKKMLTNILFEHQIPVLRDFVASLSSPIDEIILYIDNLDKGWPSQGIEPMDVRTLRHLIETLGRLRRDLNKKQIELKYVIFLRSDVFDLLVEHTPDRGKYNPISIDWIDSEQLRLVITERIAASVDRSKVQLAIAAAIPQIESDRDALDMLMEASMMRPRFLIELYENMLSFAINRRHEAVQKNDLEDALVQHSRYLVNNFGLEMRDVSQINTEVIRRFRGKTNLLTWDEIAVILKVGTFTSDSDISDQIDVLLSSGFLGFIENEVATFIYNLGYDMQELRSRLSNLGEFAFYKINPAFASALGG